MFINNPSLQLVDLGNCKDANELFSSESEFNLTIISSETINVINESYFTGNFTLLNRLEMGFYELPKNLFGGINCNTGEETYVKNVLKKIIIFVKVVKKGITYLLEIYIYQLNVKNVKKVVKNVFLRTIRI